MSDRHQRHDLAAHIRRATLVGLLTGLATAWSASAVRGDEPVSFSRDISPILSDKCLACHGPDEETLQADLRLDLRDSATRQDDDGHAAIVPGNPDASELIRRILATDEFEVMPPPETNKSLTATEQELLRRWIAEGAEYEQHWAFNAPKRPELPEVRDADWARNEIDRFVLSRLEAKGMRPSGEADRHTLIRRVSSDLRGLPPTLEEIDAFVNDASPNAYERMVDRMLASPHYGEKLALIWMDLARYGDTNGYHYDSTRQVWLWRDWVIRAFNENMPFDQFTIEQLAGDLLPEPTLEQKIASGFNRNTRYNEEGGADPAEFRVRYAVDRTNTLGQVWLGLTVGCAECHSHKYDPVSQREYYQLYAFFNSLDEPGAQGHNQKYPPLIEVPTPEQEALIAQKQEEIAQLEKQVADRLASIDYSEPTDLPEPSKEESVKDVVWIDDSTPEGANLQGDGPQPWLWGTADDGHPVHSGEKSLKRSGSGLNQHYFTGAAQPLEVGEDDTLFAHVWLDPDNPPKTVQLQFNDGSWEHRAYWGEARGYGSGDGPQHYRAGDLPETGKWVRLEVPAKAVGLNAGAKINGWAFSQFDGTVYYDTAGISQRQPDRRYLRSLALWEARAKDDNEVPEPVRKAIAVAAEERTPEQQQQIQNYYVEHVFADTRETFAPLHEQLTEARNTLKATQEAVPFQLVSVELPEPRPAHILMRGDFQKPGEQVGREVPRILPPFPEDQPRNRLGLAHWLVDPEHPLTARVTVNRFWAQLFGKGIVETIDDFGLQGKFPTHPDLLDWLAVEFVESGWDTKAAVKKIVMSATYRQSSANDHRYQETDPYNHLLWRSPRFRMPAEEIRDSTLHIAGMLSTKIGGPPVFPYQPQDYYKGKQGGWRWDLSAGDDRYRRGMYTFWRRTTPYPAFVIFDAPDRSECIVERARTNTPLQALTTLNDPQFVEAARVFGQRILAEGPNDLDQRLRFAFRLAVARDPGDSELSLLRSVWLEQFEHYTENSQAAEQLTSVGDFPRPEDLDVVEHAAWTAVANVLLNLDETITRE